MTKDISEIKKNLQKMHAELEEINREKSVNFFEITNIAKKEINHSAFLAWLLNPKETHKIQSLFLEKILKHLKINEFNGSDLELCEVSTEVTEGSTAVTEGKKRIDIQLELGNKKICIENKVCACPTVEQLTAEIKLFEPDVMILLAPKESIESFKRENSLEIKYLEYDRIHKIIKEILEAQKDKLEPDTETLLNQYCENLKVNIMKKTTLGDESKLYLDYRDDIEEIEKKFDKERKDIFEEFEERIKSNYNNFEFKIMSGYIQVSKKDWSKGKEYDIHFEITLKPELIKKKIFVFSVDIESGPDYEGNREKLIDIFSKKAGNILTNLKYDKVKHTYYVYKIKIDADPIKDDYVTKMFDEFKQLIKAGIDKKIEESIRALQNR